MSRSWGPRLSDGEQALRTAHAGNYERSATLWTRTIAGATITCHLTRKTGGTGHRIVELIAEFREPARQWPHKPRLLTLVRHCETPEEEQATLAELEQRIRHATAALAQPRPIAPQAPGDPSAP